MTRRAVLFSNPDLQLVSFVICMNESANSGSISCPLQVRQLQVLACLAWPFLVLSFRTAQPARLSYHTVAPPTPGSNPFPVSCMHLKTVGKDKKEEMIL